MIPYSLNYGRHLERKERPKNNLKIKIKENLCSTEKMANALSIFELQPHKQ